MGEEEARPVLFCCRDALGVSASSAVTPFVTVQMEPTPTRCCALPRHPAGAPRQVFSLARPTCQDSLLVLQPTYQVGHFMCFQHEARLSHFFLGEARPCACSGFLQRCPG